MTPLKIRSIEPNPRTYLDGTDPVTGQQVHSAIYSGWVALSRRDFRGVIRPDDLQPVSFFLPDSAPYRQPPAALWAEVSLRRFVSGDIHTMLRLGACDASAAVVPDPRGGDDQWLQLSFHTHMYAQNLVEINYRVTVQTR